MLAASRIRRLLVLFVLAGGSTPLAFQQPQFRAGTITVPVYTTVRDRDHGFILDLTKDDFEIRDDGRVRPITQFITDVQPLSTILLLDGSGSMLPAFNRAIEGASSFVMRLLPADRAWIGSFADRVQFGPGFSSDRDELLAYLHNEFNLRMGYETHLWEAISKSTGLLAEEPGRRVILVMSDGYNFVLPPGLAQAQRRPGQGGPTIEVGPGRSPIGGGRNPAGGTIPTAPPISTAPTSPSSIGDPARNGVSAGTAQHDAVDTNTIVFAVSMWVRSGKNVARPNRELERLAVDTGGAFYQIKDNDDMHAPFADIMRQLRQQYVLGFLSTELDGKRHKIEVRVKRPNAEVRARTSYVAIADR